MLFRMQPICGHAYFYPAKAKPQEIPRAVSWREMLSRRIGEWLESCIYESFYNYPTHCSLCALVGLLLLYQQSTQAIHGTGKLNIPELSEVTRDSLR
jgi:hypothetical protein